MQLPLGIELPGSIYVEPMMDDIVDVNGWLIASLAEVAAQIAAYDDGSRIRIVAEKER